MQRIEINVLTGERKVLDLTPDEIVYAQERFAEEAAEIAAKPKLVTIDDLVDVLKSKNVITDADIDAIKK